MALVIYLPCWAKTRSFIASMARRLMVAEGKDKECANDTTMIEAGGGEKKKGG